MALQKGIPTFYLMLGSRHPHGPPFVIRSRFNLDLETKDISKTDATKPTDRLITRIPKKYKNQDFMLHLRIKNIFFCWHDIMRTLGQRSKRSVYVSRGLKEANEVISRGQDTKSQFHEGPDTHEGVSRGLGTKTPISQGQFFKMAVSRGRVKEAWQPCIVITGLPKAPL